MDLDRPAERLVKNAQAMAKPMPMYTEIVAGNYRKAFYRTHAVLGSVERLTFSTRHQTLWYPSAFLRNSLLPFSGRRRGIISL
jgi:hypothetical protein